jgi:hypothetical protein
MTLRRLILRLLAVAVLVTVTAIGGLGCFNWWIRNTWMPIAPLCFDGDEVVQLTEPLTPEAKELYLRYFAWTLDIFKEKDRAERATYARVVGDQAYVRTWYWLLGTPELRNLAHAWEAELYRRMDVKEESDNMCLDIVRVATINRPRHYDSEDYISESMADRLTPWTFDIWAERNGDYTWVGRQLKRIESDSPPP